MFFPERNVHNSNAVPCKISRGSVPHVRHFPRRNFDKQWKRDNAILLPGHIRYFWDTMYTQASFHRSPSRRCVRAVRLHPLVGIISVGSPSHVVSAPFNLTRITHTHTYTGVQTRAWMPGIVDRAPTTTTTKTATFSCQKLRLRLRNSAPVRYSVPLEFSTLSIVIFTGDRLGSEKVCDTHAWEAPCNQHKFPTGHRIWLTSLRNVRSMNQLY